MTATETAGYIVTFLGHRVFPLGENPDYVFDIRDIAHALSNQSRFSGHTKNFYSIAQHSCHVCMLTAQPHKLTALLHDASEAYLVDLPRPIKYASGFEEYRAAEDRIMRQLARRFDFAFPLPPEVKQADDIALATEARDLLGRKLPGLPDPDLSCLFPLDPETAEDLFLEFFASLVT